MAGKPGPKGPQMTATLHRHIEYAPSDVHYKAAARGLNKAGIKCTAKEIPRCHHIKELAIWVNAVLWCAGETTASTAMLDRMIPKQSRMVVENTVAPRRPMSEADDVPPDRAREYMESLEKPRPKDDENDTIH